MKIDTKPDQSRIFNNNDDIILVAMSTKNTAIIMTTATIWSILLQYEVMRILDFCRTHSKETSLQVRQHSSLHPYKSKTACKAWDNKNTG